MPATKEIVAVGTPGQVSAPESVDKIRLRPRETPPKSVRLPNRIDGVIDADGRPDGHRQSRPQPPPTPGPSP